jgi:hypothetical protein
MMNAGRTTLCAMLTLAAALELRAATTGLDWIDHNTNLTFYGDVRLRYEQDWDSHDSRGAERMDRNRGRLRVRLGFNYQLSEDWSVGSRVRTGSNRSQQSPHLTFVSDDGGARDSLDLHVDRYFVQYKRGGVAVWGGRNITPFWQQNELFWDEDVTPTGLAGTFDVPAGKGTLTAVAGAFFLPDGGADVNGQMLAAQLKCSVPVRESRFTLAAGAHFLSGEEEAVNLRNRNGERDYLIGVANAQWVIPVGKVPVTLGADVFNNFMNYGSADGAPYAARDRDETLGYAFSVMVGQLKQRHDWLAGYTYAHVETFAVNASYAQDDWIRFGNATQTDASDFKGHEFRLAYAVSKNINLMARLYLVDAITTVQDGNRVRLDLNWKF